MKKISVIECVLFFALGLAVVSYLTSCSAVKTNRIADALDDTANAVGLFCSVAPLVTRQSTPDACRQALKAIDSEYYPVVYDAAKCADKTGGELKALLPCLGKIDGWEKLAGKL